jgi:hypothetical protein
VPATAVSRVAVEVRPGEDGPVDFAVMASVGAHEPALLWFEWDAGDPERGFAGAVFREAQPASAIEAVLRRLGGTSGDAHAAALFAAAGRGGSVAALASRPGRPAAVVLPGLAVDEAVALLRGHGWDGHADAVSAAWVSAAAAGADVHLAAVLDEGGPRARVGLELLAHPSRPDSWDRVLERVDGPLSVRDWIGTTRREDAGPAWPAALEDAAQLTRRTPVLLRALNHLKLSLGDGEPPELKAYLAVELRWL